MFKLSVRNNNKILAESSGEHEAGLAYSKEYVNGDYIVMETSLKNAYCVIQLDDAMGEALVLVTGTVDFVIPFEEKRISYSPKAFYGKIHYLHVREAREDEISGYRNLALNVYDQHGEHNCFPHAFANVETRGESVFAARNAIDGVCENRSHGAWPYESWGINMRDDAEMTVDFGCVIETEKIVLYTRADFPHDNWWKQVSLQFSDGSIVTADLEKSYEPHTITFPRKQTGAVRLFNLIKADDPSPFPALSQIQVYGYTKE